MARRPLALLQTGAKSGSAVSDPKAQADSNTGPADSTKGMPRDVGPAHDRPPRGYMSGAGLNLGLSKLLGAGPRLRTMNPAAFGTR